MTRARKPCCAASISSLFKLDVDAENGHHELACVDGLGCFDADMEPEGVAATAAAAAPSTAASHTALCRTIPWVRPSVHGNKAREAVL